MMFFKKTNFQIYNFHIVNLPLSKFLKSEIRLQLSELDNFLDFQSYSLYWSPHIRVPTGLKHPEVMEMLGFGLSHKRIEIL